MRRIKYNLITADYDFETNDINLYSRDANGERKIIKVLGFEPYFYIPQSESLEGKGVASKQDIELLSIDEELLTKIITNKPGDVKRLRSKVSKHFEADILFPRRMLIDTQIFDSFEIPDGKTMVHWSKIKPSQLDITLRKVYCDIETFSKGRRFPLATDEDAKVTINCLYDSRSKKYLSLVLSRNGIEKHEWFADDHLVIYTKDELDLLTRTHEFLDKVQPDIFTAWHLPFDKEYLDERAKVYSLQFKWNETNAFDMLKAYKYLYHKSNNALEAIVKAEELETPNYQPYKHEMWEKDDLREAILTNKSHVESLVRLDNKKNILDFYWNLKSLGGFESMDDTIYHGKIVDLLLLRYYHNKWVLPSGPSDEEKKKRKLLKEQKIGGKVLDPPYGVFENDGVFDMSRYYTEMLVAQNLSPEPHGKELGVVPQMTLDKIKARLVYDQKLKLLMPGSPEWRQTKEQRNSVKFFTESIIGYFGSEPSRLFNLDIYNSVTMMGQRGLLFLQKKCNADGNKVIYGDTDGLTVNVPNVEYAKSYVSVLNNYLKEFCREEKISRELVLKLDRFYSVYLIKKKVDKKDGEDVERGVKKRYAGRVCLANLKKNKIWTTRGTNKPVGEIRIGDKLMAFNGKKIVETEVKEIFERDTTDYLRIEIEKNESKKGSLPQGGSACPIIVTPEHPFYINGKWVKARDLKVGDSLFFTNKNEKQKIQFIYDELFKKAQYDQIIKNNQSQKMRNINRKKCKKWWREDREKFLAISKNALELAHSPENIEKAKLTKERNGTNERISELKKEEWKDPNSIYNSPEYREKTTKARLERPSYLENLFIQIADIEKFPIKYVGDGKFWLNKYGETGNYLERINPDFIVEGQKKVIEVYGSDLRKDDEIYIKKRTEVCEQNGYQCLFLKINTRRFDRDEIIGKLNNFIFNGVKITNIRKSRVKNVKAINFHCEPYNNYFANGVLTHNCWEDGQPCDYLAIVGFEYVRRDAPPVTKRIQPTVFDFIFDKKPEKIKQYLKTEVETIRRKYDNGELSFEDIAIPKTLNMKLSDYGGTNIHGKKKGIPDYVRGAHYSNDWFGTEIRGGDQVRMLYVKNIKGYPKTDVVSYLTLDDIPKEADIEVDLDKMIDRCVKRKIDSVIELIGLDWNQIFSKTRNLLEV